MSNTHIVIVNYNAGDWLSQSVKSALAHSKGAVTVVDNNSTDDSVTQAKNSASLSQNDATRLNWVMNRANVGFAAANNQVLNVLINDLKTDQRGHANESYAVLMNPDCELSVGALSLIINAFKTHPRMALASCQILNDDGSLQTTCRRRFPTPWSALVRMLQLHRLFPNNPRFNNFDYGDTGDDVTINSESVSDVELVEAISGAFMVARLSAVQEVGLLDETYFMHCEDLDWCKRFANAGWQVGFVQGGSVRHAKGVSTQSRPIGVLFSLHKGMNRFFDKFYKEAYSWPIRYSVKLGIVVSFCARALTSLLRGR